MLKQTGLGDKFGLKNAITPTPEASKSEAKRKKKSKTEELVKVNIQISKPSKQEFTEQS